MSNLIIGMGQIGKAVHKVIKRKDNTQTLDIGDDIGEIFNDIDVMHICFPWSDEFIGEVKRYISFFEPKFTVIYSTLPIGTCALIDANIAHSPVEGRHPHLANSIWEMTRWVGYNKIEVGRFFHDYYTDLGLKVRLAPSTYYTEALKLLSTSEYGAALVFADYKAKVAEDLGMDHELVEAWNTDYNQLYQHLDMPQFQKFVLKPPKGKIGGHCVVPNAKILAQQYPNDILDKIIEMEKK